jgi:hypothetical protein
MTGPIWPWGDSPQSSDWPWLRNVSTSVTLTKGEDYPMTCVLTKIAGATWLVLETGGGRYSYRGAPVQRRAQVQATHELASF